MPSPPAGQPVRVALFRARASRLGLRWRRLPRQDRAAARVPNEAPQHHPADGKEADSRPQQRPANLGTGAYRRGVRWDDQKGRVIAPAAIPGRSASK